ncbi:MAG: hypothetical protein U0T84_06190 [Chitinophagales bacterium]
MQLKQFGIIMGAALVLLLSSCAKKTDTTNTVTVDGNSKQHNEDVQNTKTESDNVNTDINGALSGISGFGKNGAVGALYSICGATIDSSHASGSQPYIDIHFDGITNCSGRIRSGDIRVQLISGAHWSSVGAMLQVTHTNYKVTFPGLNNHSLTFNGVKYLTDVSGIDWIGVYFGTKTVSIRERSYNTTVTFDNGNVSSWNSFRLSTWGISNGTTNPQYYAIVNGDTTIDGKVIDSYGKTRFNTDFITEMVQPWKSGTACGWWRPTAGIYTSRTDRFTITATFGTDASGTQVTSGCAYGFKLNWALDSGSVTGERVLAYW